MRKVLVLLGAFGCLVLTACASGGGGSVGGGGSTTPPPPPPPPPNTSLSDLHSSQDFDGQEPYVLAQYGGSPAVVQTNGNGQANVTVHYDQASQSYSVTFPGIPAGSETFAATSKDASSTAGNAVYKKTSADLSETLTVTSQSPSSGAAFTYVAAGALQRNQQGASETDVFFQPFVWGFPTAAANVPRTGSAGYDVDVNGFMATVTTPPRSISGTGALNVDFLQGLFSLNATVVETDETTGVRGRTDPMAALGHLASDGSFSSPISLDTFDSSDIGVIKGNLYGPQAQEVGATFAFTAYREAIAGSVIGTKRSSGVTQNLSLTNLLTSQTFVTHDVIGGEDASTIGGPAYEHVSSLVLSPGGSANYTTADGATPSFSAADEVAADPNFTVYKKSFGSQGDGELDLYRPGTANSELALTYASFGEWRLNDASNPSNPRHEFFTYGVLTPYWTVSAKTGTAKYVGVVHGEGDVLATSIRYDLSGTVSYNVDFSADTMSGSLSIKGVTSGGSRDFGVFDTKIAGPLGLNASPKYAVFDFENVTQNGVFVGQMSNRFFGPDAEEIAGIFNITVGGGPGPPRTTLNGVELAKRQ